MLPKDPVILLSVINTKLRDEFENFDELCVVLGADAAGLTETLHKIGYHYDAKTNQFI